MTSPVNDEISFDIQIAAPPDRIFDALIDPAQVPKWWGGQGAGQVFRCNEFTADLRVSGRWKASGVSGNDQKFEVTGEFLEINRARKLRYTWVATWTGTAKTQVEWELQPGANGTHIQLRQSGLAAHPEIANSYRGWPRMLEWLRAYVERGETTAQRMAS